MKWLTDVYCGVIFTYLKNKVVILECENLPLEILRRRSNSYRIQINLHSRIKTKSERRASSSRNGQQDANYEDDSSRS